MGAIADAMANYAQPLLDATDGSHEQMSKAFALSTVCWNLALLPEEDLDESLAKMRPTLMMEEGEFEDFLRTVVGPMIRRHHEMFPGLGRRGSVEGARTRAPLGATVVTPPELMPPPMEATAPIKKQPGIGRNAPCPCNSGRKYKHCCGRR